MPYYIKKKSGTNSSKNRHQKLVQKLDKIFSIYIRVRDTMPNGMFRCISCGQIKPFEQADCGHYHSRTHMSTRFSEDNTNAECRFCNRFKADHMIGYRENLIAKIGQQRFDLLDVRAHSTKQWFDFELEEMIKHYTKEAKIIIKQKGLNVSV